MEKIKVLIVEDKLLIAEDIAIRLRSHAMEVTAICITGEEAIVSSVENRPDLILMDIELAGEIDGIETALAILAKNNIPVIFLSDFDDKKTVDRAKKVQPANYLTKPFNEVDLIRAIDLAFSNAKATPSKISFTNQPYFARTKTGFVKLPIKDVIYLEADRAYCNIYTTGQQQPLILSTSMNHVFAQFDSNDFIKVHRSFIVNIHQITAIEGNVIKLGQREVQMSKDYRDNLIERVKLIR